MNSPLTKKRGAVGEMGYIPLPSGLTQSSLGHLAAGTMRLQESINEVYN